MTIYRRPDPIPIKKDKGKASLGVAPIRGRRDLYEEAAFSIFQTIWSGQLDDVGLLPGENELVSELGVSRTVVREATKYLASKGILETRRRLGTQVLPRDRWNLIDADLIEWMFDLGPADQVNQELWDAFAAAQPEIAALAAQRRATLSTEATSLSSDAMDDKELIERFCHFHQRLTQATGNRFLSSLTHRCLEGMSRFASAEFAVRIRSMDRGIYPELSQAVAEGKGAPAKSKMQSAMASTGKTDSAKALG
ncbi:MAG: GntR family transcriptional regulator [Pseudomonadota bacterium]